uniref:Tail tubular protein n=1 Tax=Siphoviridae sp. ct7Qv4 TaxID=2827786 RepID=A0A8S5SNQ1_9CAUD|nr:MAG TPA: tail tubular protein [Siphoviridae sp. ct7Qv4]
MGDDMDTCNAEDIKYLALSLLGRKDKPNFVTSTEPEVVKINFIYPQVMYHTLQRYRWGFARKYIELQKSDVVGGRYKNNFILPQDFLYLRGCYSNDRFTSVIRDRELNVVDGFINTDSEKCFIEYTRYVEENKLPQYFIEYIKFKIALDLCMDLTGDTDLLQILDKREAFEWINATNIDARQQRVKEVDTGVFVDVRR